MKKISILLILLFLSVLSFSQKIENVHAEQQGKQVVITYDIIGAQSGQTFDIKLLYSQNGYDWKQAMEGLTGDIGNTVSAGTNKIITWEVLQNVDKLVGAGFMFKVKGISNVSNTNNDIGTFTDTRDGKIYKWVKIGNQTWMAENLNYKTSYGSWCFGGNSINCQTCGRLYDWKTAQTVCPQGWHLPSDDEWIELIDFLGGTIVAGEKMKQPGRTNWNNRNANATNSSGFNARGCGYSNYLGDSKSLGDEADFWSSTESDKNRAWGWSLLDYSSIVKRYSHAKDVGFSSRCLQDK